MKNSGDPGFPDICKKGRGRRGGNDGRALADRPFRRVGLIQQRPAAATGTQGPDLISHHRIQHREADEIVLR